MDIKHQSLVLDINETRNYTFIKACQGDQKSRYIDCTLTQNGSVLSLTSNYRAIIKASINNEVKAINSCTIDTNLQVVVVELTSTMLDTPGVLNCEITVQDGQQIVTSQAFAVQVRQSTIANETEIKKSKEYGALVDALSSIADVESKADKVQGLVDNIDKLESANDIVTRLSNVESKETQLETQHKTDVQDLTDKANSKIDTTDFNAYKTATDKAIADNTKSIKANTTAIDKCVTDIATNSALISKSQINVTTDKSTSIVLNDSSDSNIVDLKLHNAQANLYICGKNFADFNTYFAKAETWDRGTNKNKIVVTRDTENKTITFNSVNDTDRSGINVRWKDSGIPVSCLTNKTITVSLDVSSTDDCKFFLCNACDNYKNKSINTTANIVSRVALTTKMPSDISSIQDANMLFHIDSSKTTVTLSNFQIELSSTATDYEDYKESQTITNDTELTTVHTYYPTTTVISDSDFALTYVADTKNYIDNKFNELATALIAHESEVN